ncbi:hypothetical protein CEXT_581931 [Caerostris extrusa]|uniref:Uncharacterized protein n=1 Tax=Caerostris extrusa TaxID=172846 RepID=A0AAV4R5I6_CAEEX|nr:hypothetical protein CEXT_581931 [Caerostris extrusa]
MCISPLMVIEMSINDLCLKWSIGIIIFLSTGDKKGLGRGWLYLPFAVSSSSLGCVHSTGWFMLQRSSRLHIKVEGRGHSRPHHHTTGPCLIPIVCFH